MDERKRDKYRSKLKIIYLQNSLPEEEYVLRELETLDKSFYEALDLDMFATLEHFEEYFEEYLANRLQTHLACANGNPHIVALIKNEEAWEAHLIRLDVREDIQKIKAREEAAKKKASDELTKIGEARETYRQAATAALGEYLKKSASPDYETFKSFLVTKELPVTEYEDILDDAWDLKDALLMSIQAQEASEKREAQEKEREALAKKEELDRQRRAVRELFLARVEKEQAEAKQRAAAVEQAQKLAAQEDQRKAREEAEAAAAKEQFARRIRERYEADLKAKIAELRLAAQKDAKK